MWIRMRGSGSLGEALEHVRRAEGLTQAELSERLDVSRSTVIDMEKGRPSVMQRLTDAFSTLGYDLVVVPRSARVEVHETESGTGGRS